MIQWEYSGESSRSGAENITGKRPAFTKSSTSEYNPAKLLLNGVGWSVPQSQGIKGGKNMIPQRLLDGIHQNSVESHVASNLLKREPWFWLPSPADSWEGPDFLGRVASLKDELPWKIRASIVHSIRAHHGALRSLAVTQDECLVFTAGIVPGFKGTVQKWELSKINCMSGYYGHEEVCNCIFYYFLPLSSHLKHKNIVHMEASVPSFPQIHYRKRDFVCTHMHRLRERHTHFLFSLKLLWLFWSVGAPPCISLMDDVDLEIPELASYQFFCSLSEYGYNLLLI